MFTVDVKQQHNNICGVRISWFNENDILAQIGGLDIIWLQIIVLINHVMNLYQFFFLTLLYKLYDVVSIGIALSR